VSKLQRLSLLILALLDLFLVALAVLFQAAGPIIAMVVGLVLGGGIAIVIAVNGQKEPDNEEPSAASHVVELLIIVLVLAALTSIAILGLGGLVSMGPRAALPAVPVRYGGSASFDERLGVFEVKPSVSIAFAALDRSHKVCVRAKSVTRLECPTTDATVKALRQSGWKMTTDDVGLVLTGPRVTRAGTVSKIKRKTLSLPITTPTIQSTRFTLGSGSRLIVTAPDDMIRNTSPRSTAESEIGPDSWRVDVEDLESGAVRLEIIGSALRNPVGRIALGLSLWTPVVILFALINGAAVALAGRVVTDAYGAWRERRKRKPKRRKGRRSLPTKKTA
jgi:hypothetical protein